MAFENTVKLKNILRNPDSLKKIYWVGSHGLSLGSKGKIRKQGSSFIFHSDDLPQNFNDPEYESSNPYQLKSLELIDEYHDGIVVDLGAGNPKFNFPNVCQLEIRKYPHTDIVTAGDTIPLQNNSVNAVISEAVLEHVKNPFKYVSEILRILKPGGKVVLDSAFMQPLHGYPHHYFNTTTYALQYLFQHFEIKDLRAGAHHHPWITLQWMLNSFWFGFKDDSDRDKFRNMKVGEIMDTLTVHQELRAKIKENDDPGYVAKKLSNFNDEHEDSLGFFAKMTDQAREELSAGFQIYAKKPGRDSRKSR